MKYIFLAAIAIVATALSTVNWWLSSIAANNGVFDLYHDMTALIGMNIVLGVTLSVSAVWLWNNRQKIWFCVAVFAVICLGITDMHYTVKRVGSMSNAGVDAARGHNTRIARAYTRVEELKADVKAEAANGGCGKECRKLKVDLREAQAALSALGARRVEDSAAESVSVFFGGMFTPEQYLQRMPVITAAGWFFGCNVLFAILTVIAMSGQVAAARVIDVTPNPVVDALRQHGALSNRELARRAKISETKSSRIVKRLCEDGQAVSEQCGRQKVIKLVA